MARGDPRLNADDTGVWRRNETQRFGLAWDEIEWVLCAPSNGASGAAAVSVELYDKDGGSGFELGARKTDTASLPAVAAAFGARLGLPPGWYADLQQMTPQEGPRMVWAREAPPRIHADDSGLWCSEFDQFTEWGRIDGIVARRRHDAGWPSSWRRPTPGTADCGSFKTAPRGSPSVCGRSLSGSQACPRIARADRRDGEWRSRAGLAPELSARLSALYADDLGVCREDAEGDPFGSRRGTG
jgi:hypothetical protein